MQELSNFRSYPIFLIFCICLIPFINCQETGALFNPHAQLMQSFQNEMKSLEAAAHRVNALLMNPNLNNGPKQADDQIPENTNAEPVPAAEKEVKEHKPFEVTVLANPSILRSGIMKVKQPEVATTTTTKVPENKQDFHSNPVFNFGPLGSFFNSFTSKTNFQTPWWKGKNVCVEQSDKTEDDDKNGEAKAQEPQFVIFGTGSFERCRQTANKYVCTTVVSSPESTKTTTITYECCEGFRREGNACVEGDNTMEKISISDDSSSSTNSKDKDNVSDKDNESNKDNDNDNDKSESVAVNNVENENEKSYNYHFVPIKVTMPNLEKNTEKKEATQSVDKSYSSQSEEEDGNPVWLQNYLKGQRLQNLFNL